MRHIVSNEKGFTTTFFALLIPVILGFIGLCADGAMVAYYRISLNATTDIAVISAIDSYDRDAWFNHGRIILREDISRIIINDILDNNLPGARLTSIRIDPAKPNEIAIETEYDVNLFFLRIFGIDIKPISSSGLAHGS